VTAVCKLFCLVSNWVAYRRRLRICIGRSSLLSLSSFHIHSPFLSLYFSAFYFCVYVVCLSFCHVFIPPSPLVSYPPILGGPSLNSVGYAVWWVPAGPRGALVRQAAVSDSFWSKNRTSHDSFEFFCNYCANLPVWQFEFCLNWHTQRTLCTIP